MNTDQPQPATRCPVCAFIGEPSLRIQGEGITITGTEYFCPNCGSKFANIEGWNCPGSGQSPSTTEKPPSDVGSILAEVRRATAKFPTWPTDPLHALAVLGEEFGELMKEVVQLTYEPHKSSTAEVRKEAIQTAAMAIRFVLSLNDYQYVAGPQHNQK